RSLEGAAARSSRAPHECACLHGQSTRADSGGVASRVDSSFSSLDCDVNGRLIGWPDEARQAYYPPQNQWGWPDVQAPAHSLNIVSLKLKYAGAAFAAVLAGTLLVMALLAWQQRSGTRQVAELATGFTAGQVDVEVQARADAMARHAAEAAAPLMGRA